MIAIRFTVLILVAAMILAQVGCKKRASNSASTTGGGAGGIPAAAVDYRQLSKQEIEDLIQRTLRHPITLTPAGPNKYRGTRPAPDGTIQIPVEVTIEAERIVIESHGGGLSSKDVIDSQGRLHSDLR